MILRQETEINEAARQKLNITRDAYALCLCFRKGRQAPISHLAKFIGVTRCGLYNMIYRLCGDDLLEPKGKGWYCTTDRFESIVAQSNPDAMREEMAVIVSNVA